MPLDCRILSILPILLSATAHAADTPATQVSTVGDLASLLEGEFTTAPSPSEGVTSPSAHNFSAIGKRVQVPSLGRDIVYAELREGGPDGRIISQKLYSLKLDDEKNLVIMTTYNAGNRPELAGAFADQTPLAKLDVSGLKPDADSCTIIWHKTGGGFDGDADPATCQIKLADKDKAVISVSKTGMTESVPDSQTPAAFRRLR